MEAVSVASPVTPGPAVDGVTDTAGLQAVGVHHTDAAIGAHYVSAGVATHPNVGVAQWTNVVQRTVTVVDKLALASILTWAQVSTGGDPGVTQPVITPGACEGHQTQTLTQASVLLSEALAPILAIFRLALVQLTQPALIVAVWAPTLWLQLAAPGLAEEAGSVVLTSEPITCAEVLVSPWGPNTAGLTSGVQDTVAHVTGEAWTLVTQCPCKGRPALTLKVSSLRVTHTCSIILTLAISSIQLAPISIKAREAEALWNILTFLCLDNLTHPILAITRAEVGVAELSSVLGFTDAHWLGLNHLTGSLVTIHVFT